MVVAISEDQLLRLTILLRRIQDETRVLDKEIIDEATHLLSELVGGKPVVMRRRQSRLKSEWWEGPTQDVGE